MTRRRCAPPYPPGASCRWWTNALRKAMARDVALRPSGHQEGSADNGQANNALLEKKEHTNITRASCKIRCS